MHKWFFQLFCIFYFRISFILTQNEIFLLLQFIFFHLFSHTLHLIKTNIFNSSSTFAHIRLNLSFLNTLNNTLFIIIIILSNISNLLKCQTQIIATHFFYFLIIIRGLRNYFIPGIIEIRLKHFIMLIIIIVGAYILNIYHTGTLSSGLTAWNFRNFFRMLLFVSVCQHYIVQVFFTKWANI